jgi:sterol desaturase/sphingolipid hydroxylase (fatty acid hydroxylase superfamily)
MIVIAVSFAAGLLSWTLLEYVVHGWMGHLYNTFVTPIHAVHHRDPHAVFAIKAWGPSLAMLLALLVLLRQAPVVVFYTGMLCGFVTYEVIHYRIHFSSVLMPFERGLRERHLVHHLRRPKMCLGVISSFWDKVFGTEPEHAEMCALCASVKDVRPLTGQSNLRRLLSSMVS